MKNIKSKITGYFPKKLKTYFKKFRDFNALNQIDKKMLNFINYKHGFYIECGANDGVDQSNTWYFEKKKNWNGLLIEPIPHLYNQLIKNRSNKNFFSKTCLVSNLYKKDLIELNYNDLQTSLIDKSDKIISAKTSTLTKLLNEYNCPLTIDFFSLDVEGYEFNVIEGIDFSKYIFKYFLIETNNFDKLNKILTDKNYKFLKQLTIHDYLFKHNKLT